MGSISLLINKSLEKTQDEDERVKLIEMFRESLVKISSVIGIPKCINASNEIFRLIPKEISERLNKEAIRKRDNLEDIYKRGEETFNTIYTKQADKVRTIINQSNPDLLFLVNETYSKIISESKILTLEQTELIMIAALVPQQVPNQLKSHLLGCKKLNIHQNTIDLCFSVTNLIYEYFKNK
ncbi:hypothetical protein K502DRAFT_259789 [Neoconidiobolus thromboides FSU 785]|nr:hypothetical protein K502DRAFT_259789 [Neoconidiobolus thromboides FSU 785]